MEEIWSRVRGGVEGIIEEDGGGVVERSASLEMSCVPIFNGWEGLCLRFKVGDAASRIFCLEKL